MHNFQVLMDQIYMNTIMEPVLYNFRGRSFLAFVNSYLHIVAKFLLKIIAL